MKKDKASKQGSAIFTFAAAVVSALASIAVKGTGSATGIVLLVVAAILIVFSAVMWYQVWSDRNRSHAPHEPKAKAEARIDLHPQRLVASATSQQREYLRLAMKGAVDDVANVVGMPAAQVRSNLFARFPDTARLGMVKDACCHMDREIERTIEMGMGRGSTGRAFESGEAVRAVWKDGWGQDDIGEDDQLAKLHPDLRWILSVPIPPATDPDAVLVLNVDGLLETPSQEHLAMALSHLPRFGEGIRRMFNL